MPHGTVNHTTGEITITYNPSAGDSLIINGRRVIPCHECGAVQDFDVDGPCVVSSLCDTCWKQEQA